MLDRIVRCLQCETTFVYRNSPYRPFCSERCKMIDLGSWLNESYAIPAESIPEHGLDSTEEEEEA